MHQTDVSFTVLLGVGNASPLAYLLQLGAFRILLDAGWTEAFDEDSLVSFPVFICTSVLPKSFRCRCRYYRRR